MKYTLLLFAFCLSFAAHAQYKISSFGVSTGIDEDRVQGLNTDYMFESAGMEAPGELAAYLDKGYAYSMICENPYFRGDVALQNGAKELRLGVYAIFNRLDGISSYEAGEYIDLASYGHELGVEAAHLWRSNTLCGWHVYGGGGVQLGYGFGNELYGYGSSNSTIATLSFRQNGGTVTNGQTVQNSFQSNQYYFDTKTPNTVHGRGYAMGGASFNINKIELSIEGRWGYGFRQNKFAGATTNLRSVNVGVRYNLRRPGPCGDEAAASEWN
ncbi:MAG: hypothetical protein AB8F78_15305 [Saprospiraceae bacterium]